MDNSACTCSNSDFPDNWQDSTCTTRRTLAACARDAVTLTISRRDASVGYSVQTASTDAAGTGASSLNTYVSGGDFTSSLTSSSTNLASVSGVTATASATNGQSSSGSSGGSSSDDSDDCPGCVAGIVIGALLAGAVCAAIVAYIARSQSADHQSASKLSGVGAATPVEDKPDPPPSTV